MSNVDQAKRAFIGLNKRRATPPASPPPASPPLRPPWALPEAHFIAACTGCGECITACPTQIIIKGNANLPSIDFAGGECTFCGACVESCNAAAFTATTAPSAWQHKAVATNNCLAKRGIACQSCQDSCAVEAIAFIPKLGGPAAPTINHTLCNGCGACFAVCPSKAINFTQPQTTGRAL